MENILRKCGVGVLLILTVFMLSGCGEKQKYEEALALYTAGDFHAAASIFEELGTYQDSETLLQKCEQQLTVDRQFIQKVSQVLHKRWVLVNKQTDIAQSVTIGEKKFIVGEDYPTTTYAEIELESLAEFKNMVFDDLELQKKAMEYIAALEKSIEAENYMYVDPTRYNEMTNEAYLSRATLIADFYNNYDLTVAESDMPTLNDFLGVAEAKRELQSQEEELQNLFINNFVIDMELVSDNHLKVYYEFINDSPYNIEGLYLEIHYFTPTGDQTNDYTNLLEDIQSGETFRAEDDLYLESDHTPPTGTFKLTELTFSVNDTYYSNAESWFG